MERFLVPLSGSSKAGRVLKRGAQKKLRDCKKVVKLEPGTTRMVFSLHSVVQAKEVLDNAGSSAEQVLEKLRFLSCLEVSEAVLRESGVGFSVRQQKKSANAEVASLASRVISKWKEAVLAEQPSRKANRHHVTQPG